MNTHIATAVATVVFGFAALVSTALAFPFTAPTARHEVQITGSISVHDGDVYENHPGFYAPGSAAEGNANRQTRPVKQSGQTTGGNRC